MMRRRRCQACRVVGSLLLGWGLACHPPSLRPLDSAEPAGRDTETEWIEPPAVLAVTINEFVAANHASATDSTGSHGDWIELYNPTDRRVDLDGWTITDNADNPDKHELEQIGIDAGGYLLLWADSAESLGPDHLGFTLDEQGGEDIALYAPGGALASGLSFGPQTTDFAAAREGDAGETWIITAEPTPGASNGEGGAGAASGWSEPPPSCELGSDLEEAWFIEGDLVAFELACEGELSPERASLQALNLPTGASFADGAFSWQTDGASASRLDLVFAVTTSGEQGEVPAAESVTVWVADDADAAVNSQPPDPVLYTEEWGLPVLHLTPEDELGGNYVAAELIFGGRGYEAYVKIRGASSSYYPKPGYTLEFPAEELEIDAWGVSRDHLVLVSPFDDNAYVRQKLVYDLWAAMAAFWGEERLTPRSFFAVVYASGEYLGLFMALDRIDNEFLEQQGFDRDGDLYKAVNHDANFFLTDSGGSDKDSLHDGYEKKDGEPEEDYADLEALVSFTGSADDQTLIDGAEDWLDLQEFMDWFLLVHYSHAEDSAGKNAYLASAAEGARFRYVPWDFNHAWGQDWRTYRESSSSLNDYTGRNRVFQAIQELDSADAELWERYRQMAQPGGPMDPDQLRAMLDAYYARIEPSAERDWARWGEEYQSYGGWQAQRDADDDWTDYQGEKRYLYDWLDERAELFADLR